MENEEDGKAIIEQDGKRGGVEVLGEVLQGGGRAREEGKKDFRKTLFQLSRQNLDDEEELKSCEVSSKECGLGHPEYRNSIAW